MNRRDKSKTNKISSISPNARNVVQSIVPVQSSHSAARPLVANSQQQTVIQNVRGRSEAYYSSGQQIEANLANDVNSIAHNQAVNKQDENRQIIMEAVSINPGQIGEGLVNASPINAYNLQDAVLAAQRQSTQFRRPNGQEQSKERTDGANNQETQQRSGQLLQKCGTGGQNCQTAGRNVQQIQQLNCGSKKYEVYMRCVTWSRDSHGLFDYESKNIAKKNIKTQTGGKILRVNDDVEFVSIRTRPEDVDTNAKPMIIVRQTNGQFQVHNDTLVAETPRDSEGNPIPDEDVNNKMFVVVRNTKSAQNNLDYKLGRGDIVKLGRIKFNVKDYRTRFSGQASSTKKDVVDACEGHCDLRESQPSNNEQARDCQGNQEYRCTSHTPQKKMAHDLSNDSLNEEFEEEAVDIDCGVVDPTKNPDIHCKVCWDNNSTPENPLLNSCQCSGSVRFIHYNCLKYWLKQKMVKKEEPNLISYTWKQFECEICKKPYPYVFRSNGISYRLIDVEQDIPVDRNFLLLESLTFEKNSSRMVHLILPDADKKIYKLGRGHESDVRVSDISVSRCHALIKYNDENGRFYLEDNLSKFGTLVLAKSSIELEPEMTKAVQIGRSVISFTVKPYIPQQNCAPLPEQPQQASYASNGQLLQSSNRKASCPTDQLKTPSPQKQFSNINNQAVASLPAPDQQVDSYQQNHVEEMLRKKIEETGRRIEYAMQNAIAQHLQMQHSQTAVRAQAGNKEGIVNGNKQDNSKEWESEINEVQIEESKENSMGDQPYDDVDSQFQNYGQNVNLQHLLRATNHLKIAQNEFELAKRQLLAQNVANQIQQAGRNNISNLEAFGSNEQTDALRLQSKPFSLPGFGQNQLKIAEELIRQNRRSTLNEPNQYGSQFYSQLGTGRQAAIQRSNNSNQKVGGLNLSDQKTPNGHPNSFLYRAHINLNELSQVDQKGVTNLENCDSNQLDDQIFAQNFREQQLMMQAVKNINISAFQCQDDILGPDVCEAARANNQIVERLPLRLPECSKQLSQELTDTKQPIQCLMQMHKELSGQKSGQKSYSGVSGNEQILDENQNIQDEMFMQAQLCDMRAYQHDEESRGRKQCFQGSSNEKLNMKHPLMMKKTPSSPSKIFKQFMPPSQGHQNPFMSCDKMTAQQISQSKSPFRKETKEISLFSNDKSKQLYGASEQLQQNRDHSEATSTSLGPRQACMNCNPGSGTCGQQNGPQVAMINISPIKQSIIKYCNQLNKQTAQQQQDQINAAPGSSASDHQEFQD